jgi:D-amino-acid oxidase
MSREALGPSRRQWLRGAALAVAGALLPRWLPRADAQAGRRPQLYPDLSEARVLRCVAGLRPHREGGVRIEREELCGRTIVHNYGHSGAGFSLSWGSAIEAAELLALCAAPPAPVAVLGAGVIGLSSARVLQELGYAVHLYARDFPPRTTSDLAGAKWAAEGFLQAAGPLEQVRLFRLLRLSWARFEQLEGPRYGVLRRHALRAAARTLARSRFPDGLLPPLEQLEELPFPGRQVPGRLYQTFIIEPPVYLPALFHDVLAGGALVRQQSFAGTEDVLALPEWHVVDCLGLGAGAIFQDPALQPVRGHLVHVEPQDFPYLLGHAGGYIFARSDALVLGGTYEAGVSETEPEARICRGILEANRSFFVL